MALTYTEANAVSSAYYDKTITQQIYEKCPLYGKLKSIGNIKPDGGETIRWPIRYARLDKAEFINPRQQVSFEQKETRTSAEANWKYLYGHGMISWDERVQNTGKARIVNLMADKAEEMKDDMLYEFATKLWGASNTGTEIVALPTWVDSAETAGGITVSDVAEWASTEDNATTELVLYGSGSFSYMMNQATFGPDKPDCAFTTRDLWSKFESLIEPQKRYYTKDTAMGKIGFTGIEFHGCEIYSDVYATAAMLIAIDSKQYSLVYHPQFNMKVGAWEKLKQAGYPYALVKDCAWVGDLTSRMRKTSFKYTVLDYTI